MTRMERSSSTPRTLARAFTEVAGRNSAQPACCASNYFGGQNL
jgi:hypothetical protein